MRIGVAVVVGLVLAGACQGVENWPQFRGPDGQGHADEANLPVTWEATQNVVWRTETPGRGWSSPVIWGNQVWMTAASPDGLSLRALCLDKTTGRLVHDVEVFTRKEAVPINAKNSHASPTPVIEDGRVYVTFGTAGTACLATDTGKVLWRNEELQLDHKEGPGSSPILYRNRLILVCDGMDVQYVVALDTQTGKAVWKTPRSGKLRSNGDYKKAYSTGLVVNVAGQDQLVAPGSDWTYAYEPLTGREIWRVGFDGFSTVPRPVAGHGMVYFVTGSMTFHLYAVRLGGQGDITSTHVAWKQTKYGPMKPSPLLVGKEIYTVSDSGALSCIDALTGEPVWMQRLGGNYSASPLAAGGRVYVCSEEGRTTVFSPGREYKVLATNQLKDRIMASPAVSGNVLFLRTDKAVYRIEEPKP